MHPKLLWFSPSVYKTIVIVPLVYILLIVIIANDDDGNKDTITAVKNDGKVFPKIKDRQDDQDVEILEMIEHFNRDIMFVRSRSKLQE